MLTVREKLAALRSKQQGAETVPEKTSPVSPPPTAPPTDVVAATSTETPSRNPDKEDALLHTPKSTPRSRFTPTRARRNGHDSRAIRQLWRADQLRRARRHAQRALVNSDGYALMTAQVPDEEPPSIPVGPDASSPVAGETPDVDDEDGDDDEDEDADNPEAPGVEQDEEERALQSAQMEDVEQPDHSSLDQDDHPIITTHPDQQDSGSGPDNAPSPPSVATPPRQPPPSRDEPPTQSTDSAQPPSPSTENNVTHEATTPVSQPTNHDITPAQTPPPLEAAVALADTPPIHGRGFVDDEAEDEDDPDLSNALPVLDSDDESAADLRNDDDDDAIVYDEQKVGKKESAALANFHRQWQMQKEHQDIAAVAAGAGRCLVKDFDAADDAEPTDTQTQAQDSPQEPGTNAQDQSLKGETAESGESDPKSDSTKEKENDKKDATENYMEAMFRRDDSRSMVIDEDVHEGKEDAADHEAKREQQKALWKARQKNRQRIEQVDENSLSHFDLFHDGEKNRKHLLRQRLEIACRPAASSRNEGKANGLPDAANGKKRSQSEMALVTPEWLKQKACLERRQQKRQKAVSAGKWSYNGNGDREKKPSGKHSKGNSAGRTTLGASCLIRKNRAVGISHVAAKRQVEGTKSVSRSSSGPTSFKGLLSLLGKQAERG